MRKIHPMRLLPFTILASVIVLAQTPPSKPQTVKPGAAKPGAAAKPDAAKPAAAPKPIKVDVLQRAMLEELSRSSRLRILDPLYYIEYGVDDAENYAVSATLGALVRENRSRIRALRVVTRVGNMAADNTNSIFSDFYSGARYDFEYLPLDDNYLALRHSLWLATDRAYKTASEAIARKRAALRGVTQTDPLPDFSVAPPTQLNIEAKPMRVDDPAWPARIRALSSLYAAYPEITTSNVESQSGTGYYYYLNSEGSLIRIPDHLFLVQTRASLQASDGSPLYDGVSLQALDPAVLPSESGLRVAVEEVAKNLRALAAAPVAEDYVGPVLFEPRAAAQVFAEIFGSALAVSRRPVSEPGRALQFPVGEFDGRLGSRVLPEWMSVTDDPTRKEWSGRPLLGFYVADLEGQLPKPLKLVENGILKAVLATRTPVRGATATNAHARLPGNFGARGARFGNLFVESSQSSSMAELKTRLIDMIRQQGKPFGLLVRKTDFPSSATNEDIRRIAVRASRSGGSTRLVAPPVLAYRIYPDGREELVRGLRFRSLNARSFRDILAVSSDLALFDYLENGAPLALMGAGNYVVGCAVVAPGVLFEELELEHPEEELPKLPLVPAPAIATR